MKRILVPSLLLALLVGLTIAPLTTAQAYFDEGDSEHRTPVKNRTSVPKSAVVEPLTSTVDEKVVDNLYNQTIMLHLPNQNFNSVKFLDEMLQRVESAGYISSTYASLHKVEGKKAFLITIDDIPSCGSLHSFLPLFQVVKDHGMVATLAVVTQNNPNPETWEVLRELHEAGWEIAIHTETHPNLSTLSYAELHKEIADSYRKIEENLGEPPVTLVLPYGVGGRDYRIWQVSQELGIKWIVGIADIDTTAENPPFYVGRTPPYGWVDLTLKVMGIG